MQFYKIGQWVVFIKTRTKHASKGGIELAVFKAFWEVLIEVLSFGFGVAVLVPRSLARSTAHRRVLPRSHRDLRCTQASTQSRKKIKVLSLSSNRKQLRYRDRSNILGRFPNGMAQTILGMAW